MVQRLTPEGALAPECHDDPGMTDQQLLYAFQVMIQSRAIDEWAVSLTRQGRLLPYPPAVGQEANSVGGAMALRDDDWIVHAYRELGALLVRGLPITTHFQYWYGVEDGSRLDIDRYHLAPVAIPIGSQLPHAVGLAFAERHLGRDRVVLCYCGDGATSQGDFHESLTFAGVWNTPTVFYVQNNQYALSTPRDTQCASPSLAAKAEGYGFAGVQVDGNDITAVYQVVREAVRRARAGDGPTLIEGITYRVGGAHDHGRSDPLSHPRGGTDVGAPRSHQAPATAADGTGTADGVGNAGTGGGRADEGPEGLRSGRVGSRSRPGRRLPPYVRGGSSAPAAAARAAARAARRPMRGRR